MHNYEFEHIILCRFSKVYYPYSIHFEFRENYWKKFIFQKSNPVCVFWHLESRYNI